MNMPRYSFGQDYLIIDKGVLFTKEMVILGYKPKKIYNLLRLMNYTRKRLPQLNQLISKQLSAEVKRIEKIKYYKNRRTDGQ